MSGIPQTTFFFLSSPKIHNHFIKKKLNQKDNFWKYTIWHFKKQVVATYVKVLKNKKTQFEKA